MVIHNIVMDDDDDIEALRLAALQTIRPRITSKRPMTGLNHHRQIEKRPFIRPVNNPNLIAIVPTELPPTPVEASKSPSKPFSKQENNNKVVIDVIQDLPVKEEEDKVENDQLDTHVETLSSSYNSEDKNQETDTKISRPDSSAKYDMEEDVLDFDTDSIAGSEEDLLQLHDSDSDSLEKLMECIEKELSTPAQAPKTISRLKPKSTAEAAKLSDPPTSTKQTDDGSHSTKHKSPPAKANNSSKQQKNEQPRSNHTVKQKSPPKTETSNEESRKVSYEKLSPARRRYSPSSKQVSKHNSPVPRVHSPRRSPVARSKRSPSPRKRSATPLKHSQAIRKLSPTSSKRMSPRRRSITPRKRSLTPRKRSLSPRKRSLTPRKRTPTPRKRSLSPHKRSLTPRKRSLTPRKRSISPRKRSLSPRKRSLSPRRRSLTPRKRSLTPRKRSISPRKRSLSPRRRSITPRRLSPRRRSITPRRKRSISPHRRSISPRRRSVSPRRRSLSPWRRSQSPRRSSPPQRRRSPSPKKRSLSPRRRSLSPKKRSLSPRKRSASPRRRSVSPRHSSPEKRKRPLSPVHSKRCERKRSPLARRQWMRNKLGNLSSRQNNSSSKGAGGSCGGSYRATSNKNLKDDDNKTRAGSREDRPREKLAEAEANNRSEQEEKTSTSDAQTQEPVDPRLEARKRKFENNLIIEAVVNKKIRLKSELQSNNGTNEGENSRSTYEYSKNREKSPIARTNRKRIILADDNKIDEDIKESKSKESSSGKGLSSLKRSENSKKVAEEESPLKKRRNEKPTKEKEDTKKGDLRTELSRRRAERMKGASIDPMARIVQSAIEGAVGKIKSKHRVSPPPEREAPVTPEKKSNKPKGRRVHVVPAKSSKAEDKKTVGDSKSSGLSLHYRSSSPVRMSGRSVLRRNQV